MGKIKCPECLGCMDYEWVDKSRYLHCSFCRTWYAGMVGELRQVESPYLIVCPECNGEKWRSIFDADNEEYIGMEECPLCEKTGKIDRRRIDADT